MPASDEADRISQWGDAAVDELGGLAAIAAALDSMWTESGATWPEVALPRGPFVDRVLEVVGKSDTVVRTWNALRPADLYLACACLHRQADALRTFETAYGPQLDRLAAHKQSALASGEFRALVFDKLFVGPAPRIRDYSGVGRLGAWVHVVARRLLTDHIRGVKAPCVAIDETTQAEALVDHSADLWMVKADQHAQLNEVLTEAIAGLERRDRAVLRQRYVRKLDNEQLARLHGVHRDTISRWFARIHSKVLAHVRTSGADRWRFSPPQLERFVAEARSGLDFSLSKLLQSPVPEIRDRNR